MLILLRILFTGAFIYCVAAARKDARTNVAAGDLAGALWLGATVIAALACAAVWAPFLGAKVADPLTGGMVNTPFVERKNFLLQFIRWCDKKDHRLFARWFCFIEGVRAPWLPTAFVLGLKNSRSGSWLEKVYAREVFKFNNAENCISAFQTLRKHGIDPRPHRNADVNMVLISLERADAPNPAVLDVPPAPPPPKLERDKRIEIGPE